MNTFEETSVADIDDSFSSPVEGVKESNEKKIFDLHGEQMGALLNLLK